MTSVARLPEPRQLSLFPDFISAIDEPTLQCPACGTATITLRCQWCDFPVFEVYR
jgi:hypothetical protein